MNRSTDSITLGPQRGAPPSLEQVAVSRLQVDPAYQRAVAGSASQKIIIGMVCEWNWALCQPLSVSRRVDGSLFILDGQHRHAGAVARGDIPFLPCVIQTDLDSAAEAKTFVELNTRRQRLSQADIFFGMLASGDADARAVLELMEQTGWPIKRHRNTANYKPGDLECAPMLARQVKEGRADAVAFALACLRQAWADDAVSATATFLRALVVLFPQTTPRDGDMDWQDNPEIGRFAYVLRGRKPDRWIAAAIDYRAQRGLANTPTALAQALLDDAGLGLNAGFAAMPVALRAGAKAVPVTRRPDSTAGSIWSAGKAWCDQCDMQRSHAAAVACTAPFCKLKGSL